MRIMINLSYDDGDEKVIDKIMKALDNIEELNEHRRKLPKNGKTGAYYHVYILPKNTKKRRE